MNYLDLLESFTDKVIENPNQIKNDIKNEICILNSPEVAIKYMNDHLKHKIDWIGPKFYDEYTDKETIGQKKILFRGDFREKPSISRFFYISKYGTKNLNFFSDIEDINNILEKDYTENIINPRKSNLLPQFGVEDGLPVSFLKDLCKIIDEFFEKSYMNESFTSKVLEHPNDLKNEIMDEMHCLTDNDQAVKYINDHLTHKIKWNEPSDQGFWRQGRYEDNRAPAAARFYLGYESFEKEDLKEGMKFWTSVKQINDILETNYKEYVINPSTPDLYAMYGGEKGLPVKFLNIVCSLIDDYFEHDILKIFNESFTDNVINNTDNIKKNIKDDFGYVDNIDDAIEYIKLNLKDPSEYEITKGEAWAPTSELQHWYEIAPINRHYKEILITDHRSLNKNVVILSQDSLFRKYYENEYPDEIVRPETGMQLPIYGDKQRDGLSKKKHLDPLIKWLNNEIDKEEVENNVYESFTKNVLDHANDKKSDIKDEICYIDNLKKVVEYIKGRLKNPDSMVFNFMNNNNTDMSKYCYIKRSVRINDNFGNEFAIGNSRKLKKSLVFLSQDSRFRKYYESNFPEEVLIPKTSIYLPIYGDYNRDALSVTKHLNPIIDWINGDIDKSLYESFTSNVIDNIDKNKKNIRGALTKLFSLEDVIDYIKNELQLEDIKVEEVDTDRRNGFIRGDHQLKCIRRRLKYENPYNIEYSFRLIISEILGENNTRTGIILIWSNNILDSGIENEFDKYVPGKAGYIPLIGDINQPGIEIRTLDKIVKRAKDYVRKGMNESFTSNVIDKVNDDNKKKDIVNNIVNIEDVDKFKDLVDSVLSTFDTTGIEIDNYVDLSSNKMKLNQYIIIDDTRVPTLIKIKNKFGNYDYHYCFFKGEADRVPNEMRPFGVVSISYHQSIRKENSDIIIFKIYFGDRANILSQRSLIVNLKPTYKNLRRCIKILTTLVNNVNDINDKMIRKYLEIKSKFGFFDENPLYRYNFQHEFVIRQEYIDILKEYVNLKDMYIDHPEDKLDESFTSNVIDDIDINSITKSVSDDLSNDIIVNEYDPSDKRISVASYQFNERSKKLKYIMKILAKKYTFYSSIDKDLDRYVYFTSYNDYLIFFISDLYSNELIEYFSSDEPDPEKGSQCKILDQTDTNKWPLGYDSLYYIRIDYKENLGIFNICLNKMEDPNGNFGHHFKKIKMKNKSSNS